ncbi:MAG: replicative DNA helicase, partial [Zetaproteobacteria bacterium]
MPETAVASERIPPQNLEAEVSVLGAVLQETGALLRTMELLRPADFYKEAHRKIFAACVELFEKNEPVDLVTLANELMRRKVLDEVGGASYLASLVDAVPTAANVAHHARIVKDK